MYIICHLREDLSNSASKIEDAVEVALSGDIETANKIIKEARKKLRLDCTCGLTCPYRTYCGVSTSCEYWVAV